MKKIILLLFTCISLTAFGQDLKKIVNTFKIPSGWKGELIQDSTYVGMFGKKLVARWRFICKGKDVQPVEFLVFNFTAQDSTSMSQKALMYYATSNCLVASNEDIRQNSMNFIRGNYYFVEKMCPCYTNGSKECQTMVRQMSDWITGRDRTKGF